MSATIPVPLPAAVMPGHGNGRKRAATVGKTLANIEKLQQQG
jgi:hypothetical protein